MHDDKLARVMSIEPVEGGIEVALKIKYKRVVLLMQENDVVKRKVFT